MAKAIWQVTWINEKTGVLFTTWKVRIEKIHGFTAPYLGIVDNVAVISM